MSRVVFYMRIQRTCQRTNEHKELDRKIANYDRAFLIIL
jgi:hypothetical protein